MSGQVPPPQPGMPPGAFPPNNFNPQQQQQFYYQQHMQAQGGYFPPGYVPQHGTNGMVMPQPSQMQQGGASNPTGPFSVNELMKDKTPSGTPPPQAGDQKANGPGTPGKSKKPKAEVSSI